jgi:hypothetical protein
VSLAFFAFGRHSRSWYAVGAAPSAVRIASAQARWTVADKLYELVNITVGQGIDIPATRHPRGRSGRITPNNAAGVRGGGGQAQSAEMAAALARHDSSSPS